MYENLKLEKQEGSEAVITGEIPVKEVNARKERVLKHLAEHLDLPGFRKGHVPPHIAKEKVGELAALQEIAEEVLQEAYPMIVKELGIEAIGYPSLSLTKLAEGNPIGFSITTAVMPEVKLGDYKKEAENVRKDFEKQEVSVSDKELDEAIFTIRKSQAKPETKDEDIPELTDEDVKKFGEFNDLAEFKSKLRERMQSEKEMKEKEKVRIALVDKLIETNEVSVPNIFIEGELDKMVAEFRTQISQMGLSFEDYLKRIERSEADMRKEWRNEAEKRAKMQLILNEIALTEKITPDEKKLEHEVEHILEHYKDADPARIRAYVATMLINEKVFGLLEGKIDNSPK